VSLNFVLDASLVPETCPLQFDDALSTETEPSFAVKVGNLLFPAFVRPARWEFPPTASRPSGEWHRRVLGEILEAGSSNEGWAADG